MKLSWETAKSEEINGVTTYYLRPGFVYASRDPARIETVLGSCVSVFLFDRRLGCGGGNHIVYPRSPFGERSTKYGDVAMKTLFRLLREFGSRMTDLSARLIGGASIEGNPASQEAVRANLDVAEEFLKTFGPIAVIEREIGGFVGRKVIFHTHDGRLEWEHLS